MRSLVKPSLVAGVLAVVLFLAVNIILEEAVTGARVDLTEDALYTISDSTEQVLESLEDPLEVTFFFSEDVARGFPQLFAYGRRIEALLKEYSAIAGEELRLEVVNPEPFSEAEDRAVAAGLRGVPTGTGAQIYLGMVARDLTDKETVVPFFSTERANFLEYDLTKAIANLASDDKPKVALLTALPMTPGGMGPMGRPSPGWAVYTQLNELFDLSTLDAGFDAIPEETDVLLLIHPPDLDDAQLYAIDQFVLAGGRAAVFLDPYSEAAAASAMARRAMPPGMGGAPTSSDLDPLLGAWGLDLVEDKIVADEALAQRVSMAGMGGMGGRQTQDYVLWLAARDAVIAEDDPITGNLEQVNLASAGALLTLETDLAVEPLVTSTAQSMLVDASEAEGQPEPDALLRRFEADPGVYTLIAKVTGPVWSAYPDGPPAQAEPEAEGAQAADAQRDAEAIAETHRTQSDGPVALVIGADTDLFDDRFWVQVQNFFGEQMLVPMADNGTLLVNTVDNLAGSEALIGLRGRGVSQRPFEVVEDIRRQAEARFLAEEERLEQELAATEARLAELQQSAPESGALMSPAQEAEIERFRQRALEIRQQLRDVQRNLVEDIETLGDWLAFFNIALLPLLLIAVALALAWWRRRAQARRFAQ